MLNSSEIVTEPVVEVTDIRKVFIDVPSAGGTAAHTPVTIISLDQCTNKDDYDRFGAAELHHLTSFKIQGCFSHSMTVI